MVREYNISDSLVFRKTKEQFGGLSNMASGYALYVNEIIIPSAEHLYQVMRYSAYPEIQAEIISQDNAMKAKMVSNKYKEAYSRKDWNQIQVKVMRWVLEIKLAQNWNQFSELLASTGDKNIVEYAPKYKFWGAVQSGNKLIGINALGRLLMQLREQYIHAGDRLYCVDPLPISNFMLYGHPIGIICDDIIIDIVTYEDEDICC